MNYAYQLVSQSLLRFISQIIWLTVKILAAKQRNGARVTIKYEDDENVGDNFLVNDINVNEHYVTREDIKKPKLKNKKRWIL